MGLDVSFLKKPKLKPEDGIPLNILSQHKMPDMVSSELDRLYRFSKAMETDFWETLYDAIHDFLDEHDTFYGAKEVKYFGRRGSAGWMLDYFHYTNNASDMEITKEELQKFITYMTDILKDSVDKAYSFESQIEDVPFTVTVADMHTILGMCREVMDTFDWDNFDLIFYADW